MRTLFRIVQIDKTRKIFKYLLINVSLVDKTFQISTARDYYHGFYDQYTYLYNDDPVKLGLFVYELSYLFENVEFYSTFLCES